MAHAKCESELPLDTRVAVGVTVNADIVEGNPTLNKAA